MPGCASVGCTNSSEKGFLMKKFPKDPQRRKEWAIKVKRESWYPTDASTLCEVHFSPEMWEKTREDGTRKLKLSAIPTIFPHVKTKAPRKAPMRRVLLSKTVSNLETVQKITAETPVLCLPGTSKSSDALVQSPQKPTSEVSGTSSSSELDSLNIPKSRRKSELYKKLCARRLASLKKYKNKLRAAKYKIKVLEKSVSQDVQESAKTISKIFNKDQLSGLKKKAVKKSTKFIKWSDQTIMKSLKLRFACGNTGYEELLRQNLPYILPFVLYNDVSKI